MKKFYSKNIHYTAKEGLYFEDFIISVLERRNVKMVREKSFTIKEQKYFFDAYLPNGFPEKTKEKTLLEIKYSNNKHLVASFIENFNKINLNYVLVIVTLLNENDLDYFSKYDNVVVLGASFIVEMIYKYPTEWWVFIASCSDANQVRYDESDKSIHFSNPPLAASEIGREISIVADDKLFDSISIFGETDFKKRIKYFNNPAIFIGNGVSAHFGSDSWESLSNSLFDYLKPEYIDSKEEVSKAIGGTNYALTSISKYTIDEKKYYDAIYYSLYRKYNKTMHIKNTLLRSISLIKHKLPNIPLITYNYDNLLERDYEIQYSFKLPSVTSKRLDDKTSEPKVIHIHGLVPYNNLSKHSRIILTQEEYYEAYKSKKWVSSRQKEVLAGNTCIFVGSSMSDLFQMSIIEDVRKKYYSKEKPYSWKCFALLCFKNMSPKDITAVYSYYFSKGVHIIIVEDFEKLPKKLLKLFDL